MITQVKVPVIGESINEVTIGAWLKSTGDQVELDDVLCEIESEKATVEIVAESGGILTIVAEAGQLVTIGSVIAEIDGQEQSKTAAIPHEMELAGNPPEEVHSQSAGEAKVSPVAANMIKHAGLNENIVKGSGPGGKIVKDDVLHVLKSEKGTPAPQVKEGSGETTVNGEKRSTGKTTGPARKEKRERMSTLRKTISRRLLEAKNGTAMLTTINEIDMSAIKAIRSQYKELFKEKHEVGLGFMSFFTRAVTIALHEFPSVNAMIDGDEIVYHNYCDIGIAVSAPKGLVVPVIRNAERMNFAEIEHEVLRLAGKARDNKLTIDEMTGGTFSITNGGVFGSLISTPIINTPQSAILGMHSIQDRPVARNGNVEIRPMMYVAVSYDHRIIDGRESVGFLVRVKEILEDPLRILLSV